MATLNKVILIGNLTADPELKQTPSGISVIQFNIAINRRYQSKNATEGQQTADFISIVAWRQTAEFVSRYFKKGKPILVCGALQSRSYTDNQCNKRYVTEVVADEVGFVESKSENETFTAAKEAALDEAVAQFEEISAEDELPF